MLSQQIILDVSTTTADTIHYVQGEKGRLVQFSFINSAIDPELLLTLSGLTASIHILKADGNFTIENMTISQDVASYTLTENDCGVGGSGIYDVSLSDANNIIYTAHGKYVGDCRAISGDTVNSVSVAYGVTFPEGFQEKLIAGANITIVDNVISSVGSGGTSDYTALTNKPQINNITLTGNKTASDLSLQSALSFDAAPASGSTNPVTSGGVYTALSSKVDTSSVGSASGVAELDASGHVPSSQLPSYVDDVVEGYYDTNTDKFYEENTYTTEIPGEAGKIYITLDTNLSYRWTGSGFVVISPSLALGETSSTAYRGDRGKTAYDTSAANSLSIQTINTTLGATSISGIGDGTVTGAIDTISDQVIPAGGSSGQVLAKTSGTNYDVTWITPSSGASSANAVTYDGTTSGLVATNVQDAIDEVDGNVDSIDTALGNTSISSIGDGTVTGAISTLNSSITTQETPVTTSLTPASVTIIPTDTQRTSAYVIRAGICFVNVVVRVSATIGDVSVAVCALPAGLHPTYKPPSWTTYGSGNTNALAESLIQGGVLYIRSASAGDYSLSFSYPVE